jgi:DNA repair photolyase
VLSETNHPFSLVTKASTVERDIDLIAPMARRGLAAVYVTITTLDARTHPQAGAARRRAASAPAHLRALAEAGIPCGVSLAPQIPFLTDDLEQVLEAAWEAGARSAFYHVLRLPWEVAPLFRQWLQLHYPQRADRIMARVQDMRGGKDYDADFATRMKGSGPVGRPDRPALSQGGGPHRLQPRAPVAAQRLHQKHRHQQPLPQQLRGLPLAVQQRLLRGDHVEVGGDAPPS